MLVVELLPWLFVLLLLGLLPRLLPVLEIGYQWCIDKGQVDDRKIVRLDNVDVNLAIRAEEA
jgi:hypothetical protein